MGSKRSPNELTDIDRQLGARIRECRRMRGLSQQQLGATVGITYQQTHKYERGLSRIPAGRLLAFARALDVPTSWFFEGLDNPAGSEAASFNCRGWLEMSRNFAAIESDDTREALNAVARLLAAASRGKDAVPGRS